MLPDQKRGTNRKARGTETFHLKKDSPSRLGTVGSYVEKDVTIISPKRFTTLPNIADRIMRFYGWRRGST